MHFLAPSVQRKIMLITPKPLFEFLARKHPRFVIRLLCHWLNEKNPYIEERRLAPRLLNPVGVAKKMSQLSVIAILYLLQQDESLWQLYSPNPHGGHIFNLKVLPYILLELMFDLGGREGREKVKKVILKSRVTLGSKKQADILKNFQADNVIDLFEEDDFSEGEIAMILKTGIGFSEDDLKVGAYWLNLWDYRMKNEKLPPKSLHFLGKMPAERAFKMEKFIKELERRRPPVPDNPDKLYI